MYQHNQAAHHANRAVPGGPQARAHEHRGGGEHGGIPRMQCRLHLRQPLRLLSAQLMRLVRIGPAQKDQVRLAIYRFLL